MYLGTSQPYPGRAVYLPNRRTVYGMGQVSRAGGFSSIVLMASAALAVWYFVFRKKPQSRKRTARHGVRVAPLPR